MPCSVYRIILFIIQDWPNDGTVLYSCFAMVHASFLSISDCTLMYIQWHKTNVPAGSYSGPVAVASNTFHFQPPNETTSFKPVNGITNAHAESTYKKLLKKKNENKKEWHSGGWKINKIKIKFELTIFFRRHGSLFRHKTTNST